MDDELEDKVFYQTYVSHMKILSKFAVGFSSINSPLAYIWKLCRLYVLRPEVIFCGVILFILLLYLQAVDTWSRGLLGRIQATLSGRQKSNRMKLLEASGQGDHQSWEALRAQSSAYAILGRRPRMEDRFIIEENINNNTGISFFAVFDGHGGEFAADFAKDILVKNIYNKVIETTKLLSVQKLEQKHLTAANAADNDKDYVEYDASPYLKRKASRKDNNNDGSNKENEPVIRRRDSLRKTTSVTDDCASKKTSEKDSSDVFTLQLNSLLRGVGGGSSVKDSFLNNNNNKDSTTNDGKGPQQFDAKCYIEGGKINFGKLITDEVLAADYKLVEAAKKTTNIAGTTALIAIIQGSRLIVANVGDSRGVMCNSRGIAIPLSFDHKPQQVRERKRIHDAGGFIAFRGVWRVAGILATSRALGDYPLKDKNLVIANPDILTFDLNDHKPSFLILASDGLWDTFTNEEACSFIKEHINEPDFGAKSLALQSYYRGSVDNITVLVIAFKNGVYRIGSAANTSSVTNTASSSAHGSNVPNNSNKESSKSAASVIASTNLNRSNSVRTK
ncbi:protein phosphatase 1L isoform X1 [Lucilia sericata]|uniref:protein phosphatase 1L isoform X1 n=2 Tax=Lucilia sericata TaxID=13632 RepID=UPI0018A81C54|nr:protein phosphatase 1L isoform X1 [Lucilia sericata]XP_037816687.1 protein phosphatase 1L isoform X1 [Lucilia sericata]XP_037816690.1 protein phosphatase 1L isoform X1 [Lucilia sericata]XP_037816691.1 protein phosphatase 1L isoform X1 [Lucilia sericata]XP_037816692.1 protein phosphatase 1L isoform X1 [Lucilia sericata]